MSPSGGVAGSLLLVLVFDNGYMLAALERITSASVECAGLRVWAMTDANLIRAVATVHAAETHLAAVKAHLVRELDARAVPVAQGATSTAAWLRGHLRVSPHVATGLVKLATALDRSPALDAAVSAGEVTGEQAGVIDAAVRALPVEVGGQIAADAEAALIRYAGQFAPPQLGRLGERILTHVAPEVAERAEAEALRRQAERARIARALRLTGTGGGRVRITGWLDDEAAAVVRAALDPLCAPVSGDTRSAAQRRADALVDVCALGLRSAELPASGGEDARVVVTVSFDRLREQIGAATLDTGEHVSAAQARRVACDAGIIPAVLGGGGQVLDLGRTRRLVTGALRRALVLRDRGCVFPGCDRPPRWCAAHHVEHWVDGGESCLANTALLCGFHHRAVHHDGWEIRIATDGHPEFLPPAYIDPQRRPRRNHNHHGHRRQRERPQPTSDGPG